MLLNKIVRFFAIKCPCCKKGSLKNTDIHNFNTNIYECNNCKKQFI